jgi:hypothetical protein
LCNFRFHVLIIFLPSFPLGVPFAVFILPCFRLLISIHCGVFLSNTNSFWSTFHLLGVNFVLYNKRHT